MRAEHLPTRARTVGSGCEPARRVVCARWAHREIKKSLRKIAVSSLDAEKLNLGVSVYIAVKTNQHNAEWVQRFRKIVVSFPEVVDFYRLSGDVDYLIRAVVSDIRAYDDLYQRLIAKIDLHDVSSMFTMEQIKSTSECRWSMPRQIRPA